MQIRRFGHAVLSQGFLQLQPLCHSSALDNARAVSHPGTGALRAASFNSTGISIDIYTPKAKHLCVPSAQGLPFPPSLVHSTEVPAASTFLKNCLEVEQNIAVVVSPLKQHPKYCFLCFSFSQEQEAALLNGFLHEVILQVRRLAHFCLFTQLLQKKSSVCSPEL